MTMVVQIRNHKLPKSPRVFDVTVNDEGKIIRYDIQNIKGRMFVEEEEVKKQIEEALMKIS